MRNYVFATMGIFILLLSLTAASILFSAGPNEGFDGDDVFVGQGQTIETIGTMTELQVTAKAVQGARMDAERRFIEHCTSSGAAGGACGDMNAERKELAGRLRSAKVIQKECEKTQEKPGQLSCKVWLRIEAKGLKQLCERVKSNSAPSCAR